jgi:hypothetical protein
MYLRRFVEVLNTVPSTLALVVLPTRFKAHDPGHKTPAKVDLPKLRQRALDAGDYYQLVTSVIPYDSWSFPFHS